MKKKNIAVIISFSAAILVISCGFTYKYAKQSERYRSYIEYDYQEAMNGLLDSVSRLSANLDKCVYTVSPSLMAMNGIEIWRDAVNAKNCLSHLPTSEVDLSTVNKFISQTGDFAFYITKKSASAQIITDDELENLKNLSKTALELLSKLYIMQNQINVGNMNFSDSGISDKEASFSESVSMIEEGFPEYATLIYDGPLSEHIEKAEAEYIKDMEIVSIDEARLKAAQILSVDPMHLIYVNDSNGKIPVYSFRYGDSGYVDVCKNGGFILNMLRSDNDFETEKLTNDEAILCAENFLIACGLKDMQKTYYINENGIVVINFAYVCEDVMMYPDLIKVGVSTADGSIVRFESKGFVMSHKIRTVDKTSIDSKRMEEMLNGRLRIESKKLCIIPTDAKGEKMCVEFLCSTQEEKKMLIYFDAKTGIQERVLLLVENPRGTLTI